MNGLRTGELAALATAVLWTFSTLAWTIAGRRIGAIAVSFHRLLIAFVLLLLHGGLIRHRWLATDADLSTWLLLGSSGFMGFFLADVCGFKSLLLIGPRLALLVQSLAPPMAAVLSWVFLGESLALHHWAAMLVTISGVTWVVLERREAEPFVGDRRGWAQGMLLAVVSAIAQAVGMVLAREGIGEYDAVAATFIRAVGAMPAYLLLLSFLSRWPTIFLALRQTRIMVLVVAGSVIGPLAGVTLCMVALRECPAGVVTTIVNTTPVLVLPLTILLFGEQISLRAALGAVVSVAGIALMCWNG